jgi:hypothetical protein
MLLSDSVKYFENVISDLYYSAFCMVCTNVVIRLHDFFQFTEKWWWSLKILDRDCQRNGSYSWFVSGSTSFRLRPRRWITLLRLFVIFLCPSTLFWDGTVQSSDPCFPFHCCYLAPCNLNGWQSVVMYGKKLISYSEMKTFASIAMCYGGRSLWNGFSILIPICRDSCEVDQFVWLFNNVPSEIRAGVAQSV